MGSMFDSFNDQLTAMNIYVTTAANAKESSWAYYCETAETTIEGKNIGTCLGDMYSVYWMDIANFFANSQENETIEKQVEKVKSLMDAQPPAQSSHLQKYGAAALLPKTPTWYQGRYTGSRVLGSDGKVQVFNGDAYKKVHGVETYQVAKFLKQQTVARTITAALEDGIIDADEQAEIDTHQHALNKIEAA